MKELTGEVILGKADDDPSAVSILIAKRRKASFAKFYRGEEANSRCYKNWDVPNIAHRYLDLWDDIQLSNIDGDRIRRRSFSPDDLDIIENDFRLILSCSNVIGKIDVVGNAVVPTSSTVDE